MLKNLAIQNLLRLRQWFTQLTNIVEVVKFLKVSLLAGHCLLIRSAKKFLQESTRL